MQQMVRQLPYVGANGSMRVLMISLPMVEALIDNARYCRLGDQPEVPGSGFHVGKPSREKLAHALRPRIASAKAPPNTQQELLMPGPTPRAPRAPSLRSLVRLAVRCQSAEELGQKLKRRYDRQKQRRGIGTGRPTAARRGRSLTGCSAHKPQWSRFEREKKIRASGAKTQILAHSNKTRMGCSGNSAVEPSPTRPRPCLPRNSSC